MSNLILRKSKFIHIPKCSGTAIQSALFYLECAESNNDRCKFPNNGHLFLHQMPNDRKVPFTFIRNPIHWWHSFYIWNKDPSRTRFSNIEIQTADFNEWVRDYGGIWLGMYTKWVNRYTGEDTNYPVSEKIDFNNIGKTESLYDDLKRILDNIGEPYNAKKMEEIIKGDLPPIIIKNANTQSYDRDNIDDITKLAIFKTEKEIFKKYNFNII